MANDNPQDTSFIEDKRFDIEYMTSFNTLAQFIQDNHLCLVITSSNYDHIEILKEYLRTVQNRIKGKAP